MEDDSTKKHGYFNIKNREVPVAYENVQNLAGEREKTANEKTFGKNFVKMDLVRSTIFSLLTLSD